LSRCFREPENEYHLHTVTEGVEEAWLGDRSQRASQSETPACLGQVHGPAGTATSSRADSAEQGRKARALTAPDEPFHLVTVLPSSDQNLIFFFSPLLWQQCLSWHVKICISMEQRPPCSEVSLSGETSAGRPSGVQAVWAADRGWGNTCQPKTAAQDEPSFPAAQLCPDGLARFPAAGPHPHPAPPPAPAQGMGPSPAHGTNSLLCPAAAALAVPRTDPWLQNEPFNPWLRPFVC